MDSKDSLLVYAELPGVDKKDIQLSVTDESLTISVDRENRRYYKEVSLPTKVKPETAKAKYKNGVLEVTFEKALKQSKKQIKVEHLIEHVLHGFREAVLSKRPGLYKPWTLGNTKWDGCS